MKIERLKTQAKIEAATRWQQQRVIPERERIYREARRERLVEPRKEVEKMTLLHIRLF